MARKRHTDEDWPKILRHFELVLAGEAAEVMSCRSAGISDAT